MTAIRFYCGVLLLLANAYAIVDPLDSLQHGWTIPDRLLDKRLAFDAQSAERVLNHARKLKQKGTARNCDWKDDSETCVVSEAKEIEIFAESGNPDAEYFSEHLLCDNFDDFGSCYEAGCLWTSGKYCTYGVTRREVANCLRNATFYLHQSHHRTICATYKDEIKCDDDIQCNWQDGGEVCGLDVMYALTSVPSQGGAPEGFRSVYGRMRTAAVVALNEQYPTHRSLVDNLSNLLSWKPPPFDCPDNVYQLTCDYAQPLLLSLPIGTYCDIKYGRDFESCAEDDYCQVYEGTVRQCVISDKEFDKLKDESVRVYVGAIHDEFLQDVMYESVNCSRHETISRCEENECEWERGSGCKVGDAKVRQAYLKDLDDDSHPVCHAFVAADRHACDKISSSKKCRGDENCGWDSFEGRCYSTEQSIINYLLEKDEKLKEAFQKVADGCGEQETLEDCLDY